jgi:hypothetical protein
MTSEDLTITGGAGAGIMSAGANATSFLSSDLISGNGTGLSPLDGGRIVSLGSQNEIIGNTTDGSPTSTLAGASGPGRQERLERLEREDRARDL